MDIRTGEDSLPFLREIRPQFNETIIASSNDPLLRKLMVERYGCDVAVTSKIDVPSTVFDLLNRNKNWISQY